MPTSYLARAVEKTGQQAILKKVNTIKLDTRYNVVDDTSITYTSEPINYIPVPIEYKVKNVPAGWETDTDEMIWVDPDLDISPRLSYDHDIVEIDVYTYRVTHVKHMHYFNHAYKMVGLSVMGGEAIG